MKLSFWDLLAESVIVQGLLTLGVVGVWLTIMLLGRPIPEVLNNVVGVVVGFFFGGKYAMATVSANLKKKMAQIEEAKSADKVQ